jgi:formylglycine-generating enzyme required for sulfatase activity
MRLRAVLMVLVASALVVGGCDEQATSTTEDPTAVSVGAGGATAAATGSGSYSSANIGTLEYVPAGAFQRDAIETNTSAVSAFHISQCEITRAQYVAVMGAGSDPSDTTYSGGTGDPVQRVNWYQAIAFCNKLSLTEGLEPAYSVTDVDFATLEYADIPVTRSAIWDAVTVDWSASGYRLPTEAEWIWAAIGATGGTTGYAKAFSGSTGGNAVGDYAWTFENSQVNNMSQPVGTKLANELGLFDMSGNVWEWTWDCYGPYPSGAVTDYRGPDSSGLRVAHGGSWFNEATFAAPAFRHHSSPDSQNHRIGFRVVRP